MTGALARQHVLHLDAVLITHLHDDHYGGVQALAGTMPCDEVIVADGVASQIAGGLDEACAVLTTNEPREIAYGDTLHVGRFSLRMIWPRCSVDGDENCDSIELLATFVVGGRSLCALLTGDAERDETGGCIGAGDVGDIDVLKVGHHGSEVSLTQEQANVLNPEVSIASAGEGNSYGHPSEECVATLEEAGSWFICTKDVGDVEVRPGAKGPIVSGARAPGEGV